MHTQINWDKLLEMRERNFWYLVTAYNLFRNSTKSK
jgi:hypothetical protein